MAAKAKLEAVSVKQMERIGKLQAQLKKSDKAGATTVGSPSKERDDGTKEEYSPQRNRWSEMYRDRIVSLEIALKASNRRCAEQSKSYDEMQEKYIRQKYKNALLKQDQKQDEIDMEILIERIVELEKKLAQ